MLRFARTLGSALNECATIVHPTTDPPRDSGSRWQSNAIAEERRPPAHRRAVRERILKLAKDDSWGYTRIRGELKKIAIKSVTRSAVNNILKRNGYETGPKRGAWTWDDFHKCHAKTMWQCDFFFKKVVSATGLRGLFALVFLHVETRRVFISQVTYNPDEAWVLEQAEAFKQHLKDNKLSCEILMHDRDTMFTKSFNEKFSVGTGRYETFGVSIFECMCLC